MRIMNDKKIKIIVDSSVDLSKEFFESEDITVLHYPVTIGGKTYEDGVDIDTKKLFELIDEYNELPKTSAFGPGYYQERFEEYAKEYDDVIYIGLGSDFSSSLSSAVLASNEFDNVHIIDSGNLSSGTGLLVLKICKFRKEGMDAKTIISKIEEMVPLVRTQFAIDTLKYLYMGGRCKGIAKYVATALHIKPIIAVRNGKMDVTKKPIGYRRALDQILDQVREDKDNIDLDHILVTHPMADSDAVYLKNELYKMFDKDIILETRAGGTVGTHCGPRTIGILYILKK